ncbi:acyltransferase [Vibrio alginolyticus]
MQFRQDINGLRAVAVLGVILYHFQPQWITGGFAGVDIFFVISGFLMTGIIFNGFKNDNFSLLGFYISRANRIIPPLAVLCIISLILGALFIPPIEYSYLGKAVYSSVLFFSNVIYWKESGYFDTSSNLNWLLHTWSLSVEWQFYILYPLVLVLAKKLVRIEKVKIFLFFSTLASFFLSIFLSRNYPNAGYFLLPTRGWEMLVGGLVYLYPLKLKKSTRNALSIIAIAAITVSYVFINSSMVWPSYYTLIPVIGVVLFLYANKQDSIISGNYLCQKLGTASYSIYLWHWPVVVFINYFEMSDEAKYLGMIIAIFFGLVSFRYIEKIKLPKVQSVPKALKEIPFFLVIFSTLLGTLVYISDGFSSRGDNVKYNPQTEIERLKPNKGLNEKCDLIFNDTNNCRNSEEPEVLVWGDSFAMHLVDGILASNPEVKLAQMTKSACGPIFDLAPVGKGSFAEQCIDFNEKVKEWVKNHPSVKHVVMSSPFLQYINKPVKSIDGEKKYISISDLNSYFVNTLNFFEGEDIKITIFSPPPMNGDDLGACLTTKFYKNQPLSNCDFKVNEINRTQSIVFDWLESLGKKYNVVNLKHHMCQSYCKTHIGEKYLYRDAEHLSKEGSKRIGYEIDFYELIVR